VSLEKKKKNGERERKEDQEKPDRRKSAHQRAKGESLPLFLSLSLPSLSLSLRCDSFNLVFSPSSRGGCTEDAHPTLSNRTQPPFRPPSHPSEVGAAAARSSTRACVRACMRARARARLCGVQGAATRRNSDGGSLCGTDAAIGFPGLLVFRFFRSFL